LDLFDFSHDMLAEAIRQGGQDVDSKTPPLFTRIPGEPVFRRAGAIYMTAGLSAAGLQ
jgi:hypothetical protein